MIPVQRNSFFPSEGRVFPYTRPFPFPYQFGLQKSVQIHLDSRFNVSRKIQVKFEGKPVTLLNELEWIDGKIWANVYMSDEIVIVDPKSGNVDGVVDCSGLLPRQLRSTSTDVLNGIALDDATGKIYLTGKNWPRLYEIRLTEKK